MAQPLEALVKPGAEFLSQIELYRGSLSGIDPALVVETGRQIAEILGQAGSVTIEQAASQGATKAISRFIELQSLNDTYSERVKLALAITVPDPTEIHIGQLAQTYSTLRTAGQEFQVSVEDRLTGIVTTKITFWDPWRIKYEDAVAAKKSVTEIQADATLPDNLKAKVQAQFSQTAETTIQRLVDSVPEDKEINVYDIDHYVGEYLEDRKILDGLDSSSETIGKYTAKVVARCKRGKVMETIRENPHAVVYRNGLWQLANLLEEPGRIKAGFQELGITQEDLEILFAVSLFDEQAVPFVQIAKSTGQYEKGKYQNIVRKALLSIIEDREEEPVPYNNGTVEMNRNYLDSKQELLNIVETLQAIGIPVNDPQVRTAVEVAIKRIIYKSEEYLTKPTTSIAQEIKQTAIEHGIFEESE